MCNLALKAVLEFLEFAFKSYKHREPESLDEMIEGNTKYRYFLGVFKYKGAPALLVYSSVSLFAVEGDSNNVYINLPNRRYCTYYHDKAVEICNKIGLHLVYLEYDDMPPVEKVITKSSVIKKIIDKMSKDENLESIL